MTFLKWPIPLMTFWTRSISAERHRTGGDATGEALPVWYAVRSGDYGAVTQQ